MGGLSCIPPAATGWLLQSRACPVTGLSLHRASQLRLVCSTLQHVDTNGYVLWHQLALASAFTSAAFMS